MKDIPYPHIILKFHPKIWKSLVTGTCPKLLYSQKTQFGPLGVKAKILSNFVKILDGFRWDNECNWGQTIGHGIEKVTVKGNFTLNASTPRT